MDSLDKKEIGKRIKLLRKEKGLKQWQMADILGATQPAIHKYENGILPEVKRLMELARIGNTTVEWILTGRHWENGAEERERMPVEICRLADRLHRFEGEQRRILTSALEMLEKAGKKVRERTGREMSEIDVLEIARALQEYDAVTRTAIRAALSVHSAVLESLVQTQVSEFRKITEPTSKSESEEPIPNRASATIRGDLG